MKIHFLGAAQTVTGSCFLIEACGRRFCVDCGMHQGNKAIEKRNRDASEYNCECVDFVLLTHAHIDHSGLLPLMVKNGFKGDIYCTPATGELISIMLEDSAHIQEMEALSEAKKYMRRGLKNPTPALYTIEDAQKTCNYIQTVKLGEELRPAPGIKVVYYEAGHILGSGSIRLEIEEDGKTTSLIFSGDIGRPQALIVKNPVTPPQADYVFMESTYGDRNHRDAESSTEELAKAIAYSYARGEKVIIPAFAIERTQEMLYCLHELKKQDRLPPDMAIFVDSPLAIRATEIFRHHKELLDAPAIELLNKGEDPFELPNLQYTLSREESEAINAYDKPAIIISASGMCNAGRIKHHLKHNIWRPGASIVFVGYQATGTPGRLLVDGAKKLTVFGEDLEVRAKMYFINSFSAHAGQSQLLDWLAPLAASKPKVVLVHGEQKAQTILGGLIKERFGIEPHIPAYLEEMTLEGKTVEEIQTNMVKAYPKVNWDFLTGEVERKWHLFMDKMADINQRPWEEQTMLQEALAKMDYAMTRLLSKL